MAEKAGHTGSAGTLALVGGAAFTDGCTFDAELLAASARPEVLIVPTADAYTDPGVLVERGRSHFEALGARVDELGVLTRRDARRDDLAEAAGNAAMLYLAGDSPMHLRSVLTGTPVWDAIVGGWRRGAVLAVAGAAASGVCDPMVDPRGGAFTIGLGLLSEIGTDIGVMAEYDTWSEEASHRTVKMARPDLALVGLPRATAIIRGPEGRWRAAGTGTPRLYRNGAALDVDALGS